MLKKIIFLLLLSLPYILMAQKLKVSENKRFLVTEDGKPFFWLADTAWELFHRCSKEEAEMYLRKRAEQGFNVIQAVALAELDGLNVPNTEGELPLFNNDPTTPNSAYFNHVDDIIKLADELGMYIALLPSWGDKVFTNNWGKGPEVFNPKNAEVFGTWIGKRYKDYDNIIWVIGGDRNPREGSQDVAIWNAMAEAIAEAAGGYEETLMSFHPQPNKYGGSSTWFHQEKWLDFNMHQSGHCANQGTYKNIDHDYQLELVKPVLDAEPLYEEHPNCFQAKKLGYSVAGDIRRIMYWNVFAGGFGQSYGCHDVWQMYKEGREGINGPLRPWPLALDLPMAHQVKHLKNLMLSRPFLSRIPDKLMVAIGQPETDDYVIASRDTDCTYAMIYIPTGKETAIDLRAFGAKPLKSWWYDTRTGISFEGPTITEARRFSVQPPSSGKGQDWVLVIDEIAKNYPRPGMPL
ncbi:MAG: glycoside hydrolase family 140 protein [Bacteroidia bacterium]|nr:glycoside hydrolase family 140 protein [Bacteroidia bacterium]